MTEGRAVASWSIDRQSLNKIGKPDAKIPTAIAGGYGRFSLSSPSEEDEEVKNWAGAFKNASTLFQSAECPVMDDEDEGRRSEVITFPRLQI